MPKIAISYRRSDSSAMSERIFDRLADHYGRESVFMDIDNIPYGVDFRKHIQATLSQSDVLIVVVGQTWLGAAETGPARIQDKADPVRVEVEGALQRSLPLIPVLVDDAKMPTQDQLPRSLREFPFLNAAEVDHGRDFHTHMDRLIRAIDRVFAETSGSGTASINAETAGRDTSSATGALPDAAGARPMSRQDLLLYLAGPVLALLIAHHLIVNSFNLNTTYLRIASFVIPLLFGFIAFWRDQVAAGGALATGTAAGLIAVAGMAISEGLNSGQPIIPTTVFEWRENIEYAVTIALSFVVGHGLARVVRMRWQGSER